MALGFKMGASGEKPRTETFNVTENGTFDMGAKNLYRYVKARVKIPKPRVDRLSYIYAANTSGDHTFSITKPEGYTPLIQLSGTVSKFYVKSITDNSLTVTKTGSTSSNTTVYVNVVWVPNIRNATNLYNQTIHTSGDLFQYGFTAGATSRILINVVNFSSTVLVRQYQVTNSGCAIAAVGSSSSHNLIQIFEFEESPYY